MGQCKHQRNHCGQRWGGTHLPGEVRQQLCVSASGVVAFAELTNVALLNSKHMILFLTFEFLSWLVLSVRISRMVRVVWSEKGVCPAALAPLTQQGWGRLPATRRAGAGWRLRRGKGKLWPNVVVI